MADEHQPRDPEVHDESGAAQSSDRWIDETMADGDVANGEGDPESHPERGSEK